MGRMDGVAKAARRLASRLEFGLRARVSEARDGVEWLGSPGREVANHSTARDEPQGDSAILPGSIRVPAPGTSESWFDTPFGRDLSSPERRTRHAPQGRPARLRAF